MEYQARYLYSELANAVQARARCIETNNTEPVHDWNKTIKTLVALMPRGSGFDAGTEIDADSSHAEKLVFHTSYHHMTDGFYDGWTEHTVTVTPSFIHSVNLRISGRNRNDIKEYIHEAFHSALTQDVTYELLRDRFPQFAIEHKWEEKDGAASQCYQAFYVNGVRYWNDYESAHNAASRLMQTALVSK